MTTPLPASLVFGTQEDIRFTIAMVSDSNGTPMDISGMGSFSLVWTGILQNGQLQTMSTAQSASIAALFSVSLQTGSRNTLTTVATLASITNVLVPDVSYVGALVRTQSGTTEQWATVVIDRASSPPDPSSLGAKNVTITRSGSQTLVVQTNSTSPGQFLTAGTLTPAPYTAAPAMSVTGVMSNFQLNLTIPSGAPGVAGPAGNYNAAAGGAVNFAQSAALAANTYNNSAGTITATANGALSSAVCDGVTPTVGMRCWIWDYTQGNGSNIAYGIYTVTAVGDSTHPWILTRATDANTATLLGILSAPIKNGGTSFSGWLLAVTLPASSIVLGTTPIPVSYLSGNAAITTEAAARVAGDAANAAALLALNTPVATEAEIDAIFGALDADGYTYRRYLAYDRVTDRLLGNMDALTSLNHTYPSMKFGTNYAVDNYQLANGKWMIRTLMLSTSQTAVLTTSGNNVNAQIVTGDYVTWRNTDAIDPSPKQLYAKPNGARFTCGGVIKAAYPGKRLFTIGDSLTHGDGSSIVGGNIAYPLSGNIGSYPSRLQNIFGGSWSVVSEGFFGQTTQHIAARLNAPSQPILLRVTGASIPGTGTVAVTRITPYPLNPQSQAGPFAGQVNTSMVGWVTIGGVSTRVILAIDSGGTAYTVQLETAGSALSFPDDTQFVIDRTDRDDRFLIYWGGRNAETSAQAAIDDASIVTTITSLVRQFLFITVPYRRDGTENIGASGRAVIAAINSYRLTSYPNNTFDINAFLQDTSAAGAFAIMGLTPTTQDLTDISNGVTPQTFHYADTLHLNDNAYQAMALYLGNVLFPVMGGIL